MTHKTGSLTKQETVGSQHGMGQLDPCQRSVTVQFRSALIQKCDGIFEFIGFARSTDCQQVQSVDSISFVIGLIVRDTLSQAAGLLFYERRVQQKQRLSRNIRPGPGTNHVVRVRKIENAQYLQLTFRTLTLQRQVHCASVFDVVSNTFDKLLKQLSMLMSAYGCDFVLLAGKPTTLPKIREMFVKYYPVSPDRIITLNNYRVGRWYPFANDIGYFEDPKTIVAVGALISLMSSKLDKLDGFRLDTRILRKKLIATSDYIGALNKNTFDIRE